MSEISVQNVLSNKVEIRVGNILFSFSLNGANKLIFSKSKESRVYDPAALWAPSGLFKRACRQAAAILRDQHSIKERG